MTISKKKAKVKFYKILSQVQKEIQDLAEYEGNGYTSLYAAPSGRRLIRYANLLNINLVCGYLFGTLRFITLEVKTPKHYTVW